MTVEAYNKATEIFEEIKNVESALSVIRRPGSYLSLDDWPGYVIDGIADVFTDYKAQLEKSLKEL